MIRKKEITNAKILSKVPVPAIDNMQIEISGAYFKTTLDVKSNDTI